MTSVAFLPEKNSMTKSPSLGDSKSTITDYLVREHDTLCSIAVTYNTTTSALMKLNKMTSSMLFPGQVIRVPQSEDSDVVDMESSTAKDTTTSKEYDFLAPLSTPPSSGTIKPFQDLFVVSSVDQHSDSGNDKPSKLSTSDKVRVNSGSRQTSTRSLSSTADDTCSDRKLSMKRERIISTDSSMSEPFEENFVKMNVYYVSNACELVRGVFLTTPTSVMFDPDPNCPPALEHGCEKFGIMCDLPKVISIAVYNDTRKFVKKVSIESCVSEDIEKDEKADLKSGENSSVNDGDIEESTQKKIADKETKQDDSNKLSFEFPFLYSLVKSVEDCSDQSPSLIDGHKTLAYWDSRDYLPGIIYQTEDKLKSTDNEKGCFYLCIKSEEAMMKTFSVISEVNEAASDTEIKRENEVKEVWFQIPEEKSDQLLAFFKQWSPDSHSLDIAEQNGFIDASTVEDTKSKRNSLKNIVIQDEARSRSSTNSSLEFIEDYFGDAEIKKEWELISVKEAGRRAKVNANELANDDTSLLPEMLHTSNLIKEESLLELCRHIPARCVGCPWRLLYSTFEHGMSLRTLYRKMNQRLDDGPAVVVIQDDNNYVFGAFCSTRPHISDHFYGSGESFLFILDPNLEVFEWTGENTFFIKGDPDALMLGGGDGTAGLWLDGDLRHGRSKPCLTFNNSLLSSAEDFFIQGLEVWGFDDNVMGKI